MALSFHPTTAPLFGHRLPAPDMTKSFLVIHDGDDELTDALLGFAYDYDPLDASHAALDDLLSLPNPPTAAAAADVSFLAPLDDDDGDATKAEQQRCGVKRQRACAAGQHCNNGGTIDDLLLSLPPSDSSASAFLTSLDGSKRQHQRNGGGSQQQQQQVPTALQVPEPLVFVRGGAACQAVHQNSAARQRRKRISEKTAELARLIPGAHRLSTAEMLEEGARHVKLLQAQVGVLALMRANQEEKMPMAAQEQKMQALLASGSVQERLAAEGKCLVPIKLLVDAVAKGDDAVKQANAVVRRDLGRFVASLQQALVQQGQ